MVDTYNMILIGAIIGIFVAIAVIIIIVFRNISRKRKEAEELARKKAEEDGEEVVETTKSGAKTKTYVVSPITKFMEFDTVIDNMIVTKGGRRFVMVVECQGINYDLMSEVEKNGVEAGFIEFLNTIRWPIQIYTQTRTVNLTKSIQGYKDKLREAESALARDEMRYNQMKNSENFTPKQKDQAFYAVTKDKNLVEYGKDIIFATEQMSRNKNILNKKYYVVLQYYTADLGQGNYDKEEKRSMCFAELYTRAQGVIQTLNVCGITSKILNSEELTELLYMAYNRDSAEIYDVDRAIAAQYDSLYSTAPEVAEKQIKELERKIQQQAVEKANKVIYQARTDKERELRKKTETQDDIIRDMAKYMINANKDIVGRDIAERATTKIDEEQKQSDVAKERAEQEKSKVQNNSRAANVANNLNAAVNNARATTNTMAKK